MRLLRALLCHRGGASAAEFALVLPLMLLFLLGIIDVGRYSWLLNEMEKGALEGARYAVVTDIVPTGLNSYQTIGLSCGGDALEAGDRICAEALGTVTCSGASGVSCTCTQGPCPSLGSANSSAFANIVAQVRRVAPEVQAENVSVSYSGSGIGFAGDPTLSDDGDPLSDISPLVTVEISGVPLRTVMLLGTELNMPVVTASLTLEDGDGMMGY